MRYIFSGIGKNKYIAKLIAKSFLSIGFDAHFLDPVEALHGDLGLITNNFEATKLYLFSKSGKTKEIVDLSKYVQKNGLEKKQIYLITANTNTEITELDNHYYINQSKDNHLFESGIIPSYSLVESLQIGYDILKKEITKFEKEYILQQLKANHPAGAIGEQLKNEDE